MARIFISYKRVDKDKVFKIKDQIESALGEKCWIDIDGIESDAQFKNIIIKAINECEIVLFMYSKAHSKIVDFEKDWTVRELNFAQKRGKRIVFVNLDRSVLSDIFEFDYGTKQQVDGLSKESLNRLFEDLTKWLGINSKEVSTHNETSSNEAEMAKQIEQVSASNKDNDADDGCFASYLIAPYGNKLFSYSKAAAFSIIFLLIVQIALSSVESFFSNVAGVIYCVLWIVLFTLIAKNSVKDSPLVKPSLIIGAGYALFIVRIILFDFGHFGISDYSYVQWYSFANVVNFVAGVATVIGFIRISNFFAKESSQKIASIIIIVVIVANFLSGYKPWALWLMRAMPIRSIIHYVTTYGSAIFFMFSLSKLRK